MNAQNSPSYFKKIFPFGVKDEFKVLLYSSIPLIFNNFSQTFLPIISLFFCGHIGSNELAAVTLANTFINIGSFSTFVGLSSACDTLFPQLYGGVDKKKIGLVLQKGLLISIISCLPTSGILLNVKHFMRLFVKEDVVIELADSYILIFLPSLLFYSIYVVLQKYILSQNIFYPILFINIIVNMINLALHTLFIYYLKYGVRGAALSVVLSNFSMLLFVFLYIYYSKIYKMTWTGWTIDCFYDWTEYLKLAIPGFAMLFFEWTNFEIAIITAGKLGTDDISIMSIGIQTIYIAFMIPMGIATSANIRTGQLLGENSPDKAKNSSRVAFCFCFLTSFLTAITIFLFSNLIPYAFTTEIKLVKSSSTLLKLLAVAHIADATQGFNAAVLKSIGAQYYGFLMVIFSFYVIGIPIGAYLMLKTDFRVMGYWIGFLIAAIFLIILQGIFIYEINWKENAQKAYNRSLKTHIYAKRIKNVASEEIESQESERTKPLKSDSVVIFQKTLTLTILLSVFLTLCFTRWYFDVLYLGSKKIASMETAKQFNQTISSSGVSIHN